jgi:hypothetical protein
MYQHGGGVFGAQNHSEKFYKHQTSFSHRFFCDRLNIFYWSFVQGDFHKTQKVTADKQTNT